MRYLIIIAGFLQFFNCAGQGSTVDVREFPFQVLHASEAKGKSGVVLKSLDLIPYDDVITIAQGGTLSLVHYSGFPIEIDKDTVMNIKLIQDILEPPVVTTKPKKKKEQPLETTRPEIEDLFISDSKLWREKNQTLYLVIHETLNDLEVLYPTSHRANIKDILCVKWKSVNPQKYKIEIITMFDEFIDSLTVNTNELNISGDELNRIMGQEIAIILKIKTLESQPELYTTILVKKFSFAELEFPYGCELKKATFALMTGFNMERSRYRNFEEAEKYFVLATTLSDSDFYKVMLDNFRKRRLR